MSDEESVIHPEVFTLGAVGPKGQRVFFLQCVAGEPSRTFSIKCEKEQVIAITDVLEFLLENMPPDYNIPLEDLRTSEPETTYVPWSAGDLSILYSWEKDQIELDMTEFTLQQNSASLEEDAPWKSEQLSSDEPQQSIKFVLTREQADGFARIAKKLISQGRPPCKFCEAPLNNAPENDFCPCWN